MVTPEVVSVLLILVAALILFLTERIRVDLVAILVMLSLALGGLVDPATAVSGFNNPAVLTIAAIFVLSGGLYQTGVANLIGRQILRLAGRKEGRIAAIVMVTVGFMSFFMNTIGIVALMLPVVMDIARGTGRAPSKLLMPLSYGGLLGGLTSLFATASNLLVSSALDEAGLAPFGIFDFIPVGLAAAVAGMVFMNAVGRRWLPARDLEKESSRTMNLPGHYGLRDRMFVLQIPERSVLAGRTLINTRLGSALGLHVVAIVRGERTHLAPNPNTTLQAQDRLLVQGTPDQLDELRGWRQVSLLEGEIDIANWFSSELEFGEVRVLSGSPFEQQTLPWIGFRRRFNLNVIAIRRGTLVRRSSLQSWRLAAGDTLLVHGPHEHLQALAQAEGLEYLRTIPWESLPTVYQMEERLFRLEIQPDSSLIGRTLTQSRLGDALGLTVLAIARQDQTHYLPGSEATLQAGDRLLIAGRSDDLLLLRALQDLEWEKEVSPHMSDLESEQVGLVEAVLSPHSNLAGKTLPQLRFRDHYGLTVLGIWREGTAYTTKLRDFTIQFGDALLLYGPRENLVWFGKEEDFVVLTEAVKEPPRYRQAPLAVLAMLVFLIPAMLNWVPVHLAAIAGAALLVLTGGQTMDAAYRSVDWKAIVLIAGMMPLGTALNQTGAAGLLADGMVRFLGPLGPTAFLAGIYGITTLGTCVMPTTALVLVISPIALNMALAVGLSPHAVMMTLAMAAAGSFCSPISHPANTMIMGPGGYRFRDYLRVGIPLTAVVFVVTMLVLPWFWPLYP